MINSATAGSIHGHPRQFRGSTIDSGDSLRSLPSALTQPELEREGSRSGKSEAVRTGRCTTAAERAAQFPSRTSNRREPRARNGDSHRGASSRGQKDLSGTVREPTRRLRPKNCIIPNRMTDMATYPREIVATASHAFTATSRLKFSNSRGGPKTGRGPIAAWAQSNPCRGLSAVARYPR